MLSQKTLGYFSIFLATGLLTTCMETQAVWAKPPVVVKAVPDNDTKNVDPALSEIRITFDQPMSSAGYSVMGGGETFPEVRGKLRWTDKKTFVMPVRLRPGKMYRMQINSSRPDSQKFKNRRGEPAVPYPISFRTASRPGEESTREKSSQVDRVLTEKENKRAVNLLRTALLKHYSYRDRLDLDWNRMLTRHRDSLLAAKSPDAFAKEATSFLKQAKDKHLWLKVGDETLPTYVRPVTPNANFKNLQKLVPHWKVRGKGVASGGWDDGIGYLFIETWSREKAKGLVAIFEVLGEMNDSQALIIDLRANGGGDERIARSIAGCFVDEPVVYAQHVVCDPKRPGKFTPRQKRVLVPNKKRSHFRGRIAVLIGPAIMSSSEAFVLMMKQVPGVVLIGSSTQGSSGNPQPHDLQNGVIAYLPIWKAMTAKGKEFEGLGIAPDIEVATSPDDFATSDPVIDAALAYLRSQISPGR